MRGSLSTESSKLWLPLPKRTWALTGPWHGPMLPRTVPSLLTTCRRLPARTTRRHPPYWLVSSGNVRSLSFRAKRDAAPFVVARSWSGGSVPSQGRHKSCVNGQLRPVEQTEPVDNDFAPTPADGTSMSLTMTLVDTLPPPSLHTSCYGCLHWKSSSSQHPGFPARCTMMAMGVKLS